MNKFPYMAKKTLRVCLSKDFDTYYPGSAKQAQCNHKHPSRREAGSSETDVGTEADVGAP